MDKDNIYRQIVDRNIGVITEEQQSKLMKSSVAIFGLGGLGGIVAQLLCRCGIGRIRISDPETFEATNLNRQVFCYLSQLGKNKTDATKAFLKDINPGVEIEKYAGEDNENIDRMLERIDAAVLAVDRTRACVIISRAAKRLGVPLVEGWAIPYANTRVFTKDTISLEEAYSLPSASKEIEEISDEEFKIMDLLMLQSLSKIEELESFYSDEAKDRIRQGVNPSFAPLVWLTASLMSLEVIKVLLKLGNIALAPNFALYDPFLNRMPKQSI